MSFVVFAMMVGAMVIISMNQDISLVAEDYYKQEIEYQDQINRQKNALELESLPLVQFNANSGKLLLIFDEKIHKGFVSGKVHIFSNRTSKEDLIFELNISAFPAFEMDLSELRSGKWEARVFWQDSEKEFYLENVIDI